ncbi:MAG: trypsin-like peptidase domain-containing protein [Bdellovibrionaceae bacterium]|nr:trypsin-like peptidase domain-containing protein [Pseudobdellovibrionaceae bacterium]
MKIYFRHKNQIVAVLEPHINKSYTVGRGLNCDVQIPVPTVSRFQGVLYFEEGRWHFRNEGGLKNSVTTLSDSVSVDLKTGLSISLDTFLASEKTHILEEKKENSYSYIKATAYTLIIFFIAGIATYFTFYFQGKFDSKSLMGFAENKILKFELKVKKDLLEKIKKEADLKEEDFKETVGFCTGFLVEKNILLTAHHCISPPPGLSIEKDFILKTYDNREITPKRILGFDFTKDYVFLEIEGFNDNPFFKITEKTEIGQKVFTIGNVAGEGLAIREGIISGETEDPNDPSVKYVRFSAAASPGNSGGPLLNEKGEVVALVSRKNMAENYNIGISYNDLRNGFNNFVLNKEPKEIIFDSKTSDLNFGGIEYYLSKSFRLPLIEKLDNKPHLLEVLNKFIVKIQVPFNFDQAHEMYFQKFHEVAKEKILAVNQMVRKEDLPGTDWETQATKDLPYVIPSTTSDPHLVFKSVNDKLIPKSIGLIGTSGQMGYEMTLNDWKKEKVYLYNEGYMATKGSLIEERFQVPKEDNYLVYSSVKDSKESIDISRYFIASPDFSIVYNYHEKDFKKREANTLKTMKDVFIGPEGAIVSLRYFPFLRPKAKADFKVKDFPSGIKKVKTYKDQNNRSWEYYVADFYDSFYIELFCMNTLTATHCLSTFQEGSVDRMKEELVKNFVNFELNEKYAMMDFFMLPSLPSTDLSQYIAESSYLKGFELNETKDHVSINLKDFNQTLKLGKKDSIVGLRFIPGVVFNQTLGRGIWSGFGVQFIRKDKFKGETKYELCTTGIQFEELKYNAMLTKDQNLQKSFRGLASELTTDIGKGFKNKMAQNKDAVWKKDLGKDEKEWKKQAYGTCHTLFKDTEKTDLYRTEFEFTPFKAE